MIKKIKPKTLALIIDIKSIYQSILEWFVTVDEFKVKVDICKRLLKEIEYYDYDRELYWKNMPEVVNQTCQMYQLAKTNSQQMDIQIINCRKTYVREMYDRKQSRKLN